MDANSRQALDNVKAHFTEVVALIDKTFEDGYSKKNPFLVQHLMEQIQVEANREPANRAGRLQRSS